ncbi:MAG: hypothetical protein M3Y91_00805 [Actinomycetota bacterium]|nr:hypothetical protein [Actinomycetota bacterium]
MSDSGELRRVHLVTSVQVAQATDQATLEARVVVMLEYQDDAVAAADDPKTAWFGMAPELADGLAAELPRLARAARRRGFEYPSEADAVEAGDEEDDDDEGQLSIAAEDGMVLFRLTLPNGDELHIPYDADAADSLAEGIRALAEQARGESG